MSIYFFKAIWKCGGRFWVQHGNLFDFYTFLFLFHFYVSIFVCNIFLIELPENMLNILWFYMANFLYIYILFFKCYVNFFI